MKIFLSFAIISMVVANESGRQASSSEDGSKRLQYIHGLIPDFFLSATTDLKSGEWTSSKTLAQEILDATVTVASVENLGRSLAKLHSLSRKSSLSDQQFSQMQNMFRATSMRDSVSRTIFTSPFANSGHANLHPEVRAKAEQMIWNNARIKSDVTRMRALFDQSEECLIGGYLTAEKTVIKNNTAYIVDPQYARVGPAAFDVASYLSYFVMAYYHHMLIPENNDMRHRWAMDMVNMATRFVNAYLKEIQVSGNKQEYEEKLMSDIAAFTGVLVVGRCVDAPMTPAIDNRYQTGVEALGSAMRLLDRSDRMNSISRLLAIGLTLI